MSSAFRGRPLELSIARAGRRYRKDGRAVIMRQHPATGTGADGMLLYVASAPVDFIGCLKGARGLAIEAKETHEASFPLSDLEGEQRGMLALFDGMGADVSVVIDFCRQSEVYRIGWSRIVEFLAAPWRKSLSLDWCRANGLLLPEENRRSDERRTWFLDGERHGGANVAAARVETERCSSPVITPEDMAAADDARDTRKTKKQQALAARFAARPDPKADPTGYAEYMRKLVAEGIDRQLGAKKRTWGKKRG